MNFFKEIHHPAEKLTHWRKRPLVPTLCLSVN